MMDDLKERFIEQGFDLTDKIIFCNNHLGDDITANSFTESKDGKFLATIQIMSDGEMSNFLEEDFYEKEFVVYEIAGKYNTFISGDMMCHYADVYLLWRKDV